MSNAKFMQMLIYIKKIRLAIAVILFALLIAYSIQLGAKAVIVITGVIVSPLILLMPLASVVYLVFTMAFVISGSLMYFTGLKGANWLPYLLCMLLIFRVFGQSFRISVLKKADQIRTGMPNFMVALLVFFLFVIVASTANSISFGFWLLAFKNYISVWLVMFLLWKNEEFTPHWLPAWRSLLWVAVIQFPVAIFQRVWAGAGSQVSKLNWDAIVGTFGGDPDASGLSGAMGLFMVFAALMAGCLWRREKLSTRNFTLILAASVLVIGFAEVKAAVVLIPVAALYLFRDLPTRRPRQFFMGTLFVILLLICLLYAYYKMYVFRDGVDHGLIDTLTSKFTGAFFNPYFIDRTSGEVGRIPSILLWWAGNSNDLFSILFGHGPMSVRFSSLFGAGEVIRHYTINIGMYSLPVFLWELGAVAVGVFLLSLLMAMKAAYKLASDAAIPEEHRAILNATAFGIFMITLFLPYNRDMIDSAAIQCLLALFYAYVAFWWRKSPHNKTAQIGVDIPHRSGTGYLGAAGL